MNCFRLLKEYLRGPRFSTHQPSYPTHQIVIKTQKFCLAVNMCVADSPEKIALSTSIENEDIESLENRDWIQDACIRHIICEQLNLEPELTRPGYNVVDPSWVAQWTLGGLQHPEEPPGFLIPKVGERLCGLVIPMHVYGNHWITVHISLEDNTIQIYDSSQSLHYAKEIERIVITFATEFRDYFDNFDAFIEAKSTEQLENLNGVKCGWYPNEPCAQQDDTISCGIYTSINVVRIMRDILPLQAGQELSRAVLWKFRHDEAAMMKERKALGDIVFDAPLSPENKHLFDAPLSNTPSFENVQLPLRPSPPADRYPTAAAAIDTCDEEDMGEIE